MTAATTKQQMRAYIEIVRAVADAVQALGQVPSGHLYARLMGHMSVEQYERVIGLLTDAKLVSVANHLITWTGPAKVAA